MIASSLYRPQVIDELEPARLPCPRLYIWPVPNARAAKPHYGLWELRVPSAPFVHNLSVNLESTGDFFTTDEMIHVDESAHRVKLWRQWFDTRHVRYI